MSDPVPRWQPQPTETILFRRFRRDPSASYLFCKPALTHGDAVVIFDVFYEPLKRLTEPYAAMTMWRPLRPVLPLDVVAWQDASPTLFSLCFRINAALALIQRLLVAPGGSSSSSSSSSSGPSTRKRQQTPESPHIVRKLELWIAGHRRLIEWYSARDTLQEPEEHERRAMLVSFVDGDTPQEYWNSDAERQTLTGGIDSGGAVSVPGPGFLAHKLLQRLGLPSGALGVPFRSLVGRVAARDPELQALWQALGRRSALVRRILQRINGAAAAATESMPERCPIFLAALMVLERCEELIQDEQDLFARPEFPELAFLAHRRLCDFLPLLYHWQKITGQWKEMPNDNLHLHSALSRDEMFAVREKRSRGRLPVTPLDLLWPEDGRAPYCGHLPDMSRAYGQFDYWVKRCYTRDPVFQALVKSLPYCCQKRNLPDNIHSYCGGAQGLTDNGFWLFMFQVMQCSLMAMYPSCRVRPDALSLLEWYHYFQPQGRYDHKSALLGFVGGSEMLVRLLLREYTGYVMPADTALMATLSETLNWDEFCAENLRMLDPLRALRPKQLVGHSDYSYLAQRATKTETLCQRAYQRILAAEGAAGRVSLVEMHPYWTQLGGQTALVTSSVGDGDGGVCSMATLRENAPDLARIDALVAHARHSIELKRQLHVPPQLSRPDTTRVHRLLKHGFSGMMMAVFGDLLRTLIKFGMKSEAMLSERHRQRRAAAEQEQEEQQEQEERETDMLLRELSSAGHSPLSGELVKRLWHYAWRVPLEHAYWFDALRSELLGSMSALGAAVLNECAAMYRSGSSRDEIVRFMSGDEQQLPMPDFHLAYEYLRIIGRATMFSVAPLDPQTADKIEHAMRTQGCRLLPDEELPENAWSVMVTMCCGKVCTDTTGRAWGNRHLSYSMHTGELVCATKAPATRSAGKDRASHSVIETDDEQRLSKLANRRRKQCDRIACGSMPVLCINLKGRRLIQMHGDGDAHTVYQHCPECSRLHEYDIENEGPGGYMCPACAETRVERRFLISCECCGESRWLAPSQMRHAARTGKTPDDADNKRSASTSAVQHQQQADTAGGMLVRAPATGGSLAMHMVQMVDHHTPWQPVRNYWLCHKHRLRRMYYTEKNEIPHLEDAIRSVYQGQYYSRIAKMRFAR